MVFFSFAYSNCGGIFPALENAASWLPNPFSLFACTHNVKLTGRSGNSFVGRMGKVLGDGLLAAGAVADCASHNSEVGSF